VGPSIRTTAILGATSPSFLGNLRAEAVGEPCFEWRAGSEW